MRLFLVLTLLTLSLPAHAFTIASTAAKPDPAAETHVFAIGFGHDMGTQFIESALSTYYRLREVFPSRQFLFLLQQDDQDQVNYLKRAGLKILRTDSAPLLGASVVNTVRDYRRIASIELFSHGHAVYGSALSGNEPEQRFWQGTPGLASLKGAFTRFGYVHFHGCNAGFVTAPQVSKILGVPVAGHLTGSNFEQPWSDGHWYFNDKGFYPDKGSFAKTNTISYTGPVSCAQGGCSRLVADPVPYNGSFGRHEVGLGFQKFYCAYHYGDECFGAMAAQLLSFPSETKTVTTRAQYDAVVRDMLCPSDKTRAKRADCLQQIDAHLARGNMVLSYFQGKEPVCGLDGCKVKANCNGRNCVIKPTETADPTNLLTEYRFYMQGFEVLKAAEQERK